MHTDGDTSQTYARACAIRARMIALQAELSRQPSWRLTSRILLERFELAFGFFLDSPTRARLAKIIAFEIEMDDIEGRRTGRRRDVR
jgi:hypothetical protein